MIGICLNDMVVRQSNEKECAVGAVRKIRSNVKEKDKTCTTCPYFKPLSEFKTNMKEEYKRALEEIYKLDRTHEDYAMYIWRVSFTTLSIGSVEFLIVHARSLHSALAIVLYRYGVSLYDYIKDRKVWIHRYNSSCLMGWRAFTCDRNPI